MRDKSIKRRDFIKLAGKASLLTAAFGAGEYIVSKNVYKTPDSTAGIFTGDRSVLSNSDYPDVVSIKSLDHSQAIIMAIGLIGGIDKKWLRNFGQLVKVDLRHLLEDQQNEKTT